jgi:formate dehydrogenase major subunit
MKRHISDTEIKEFGEVQLPEPAPNTDKNVAIVGAGPAGMTAAYFLRLQGHSVTVFEAHAKSGGMLRYGIPYYRLTDQTLNDEFDAIERMGVDVRYNTVIGRDISARHLEADYDALVIAIGAQGASSMRVEGEDLPGVYSGIDYLEQIGEGGDPDIGNKVVVVGGGNTAIDVARTAIRKGSEVTVLYRRTRTEMPASSFEIDEALHEGVKIDFLAAPVKIEQKGKGVIVKNIRMELGEPDASGRRRPVPIEGSEFEIEASSVISAIGQKVVSEGIVDTGVSLTRWGTIVADPVTFMTDRPGIFTCGDCQTGADIAVRAVGNARKAAYSVNQYLRGEEVTGEVELFNSTMGALEDISEEVFKGYEKKPRVEMPLVSDNERVTTFVEIETGFSLPNAKSEAERCLECGCEAVDECKLRIYSTEYGADQSYFAGDIRDFQNDHTHSMIKMEVNKCINCGACVRACAEIKHFNVLAYVGRGFTTRMVSPFGRSLVDTICDGCGECVTVCPTAGIMYKKGARKETVNETGL